MSATAANQTTYSPGLEGVVAGETAISSVEDGLRYRGYPVGELVDQTSFEEVAYLMIHGELPTGAQLKDFNARIIAERKVPDSIRQVFRALPKGSSPLDALRTAVSILSAFDPDAGDNSHAANLRKAERLLAQMPITISDQFRISKGQEPVAPRSDLSHSANFLYMVRGTEPKANEVHALDVSMILYAEHEFNASTFTARVIVSTMSDLHSAIVGAIGALKGPLHGGANEKVMDVVRASGGPQTAAEWTRAALARKERIMGFGHRVYKTGDVRAGILKPYTRKAAEAAGAESIKWEDTADIIEKVMETEKNMHPNVDWPAGRLYHTMGLEIPVYTPMFAMSRITGWSAHVIEQLDNNRLIRPRGLYKGPEGRHVKPIAQRG